ncbi:MAG: coproporphyrinogen-III oxidase family protein [Candidatus Krumholzibacteria bacterium]|nr:coproporphyrinogen-III oxidase family protein [Candidatus Krumholzibacteria bacterium]MDP6669918.1 coproporphyrinogen-III oxidase family protein [Candidatus Krumholzibacteria bacterium]MDP6796982.1 coproporphyrinogen-III oxidase family protein [Candidatus Krumholzibacteria bacterium]MDP7022543.1 coproporphyrinogen-III oxidase family protein [Candidatus Krumholzibacteria bacterium]
MSLSLYVHVPFCRHRCTYCNFYFLTRKADPRYLEALKREFLLRKDSLPSLPLNAFYLGGGTPSWLPREDLRDLLGFFAPCLSGDTEGTMECNPEDLGEDLLEFLESSGMNRISLGLQSLSARELKRSARGHSPEKGRKALALASGSKLDLSVDLIIGLPEQTEGSFRESLEEVLDYSPEHLSLYTLELDEPVPLRKVFQKHPEWDPGEDFRATCYLWAHERLAKAGYEHYEVSNWALPGKRCAYNESIWQGGEYMGLGPSAHSCLGGQRFGWPADLELWQKELLAGRSPSPLPDKRGKEEKTLEELLLGLRTDRGIAARHPLLKDKEALLASFRDEGWASLRDGHWCLSAEGWIRMDGILSRLNT